MTEKNWRRVTGWAIGLVGLLALVLLIDRLGWLVTPVLATLAPFVIAFVIAFLMNPLLSALERKGLPRWLSVALTSVLFLSVFAAAIFLWVPRLVEQGTDLAKSMPQYVREVQDGVERLLARLEPLLRGAHLPTTLPGLLNRFSEQIRGFSASALSIVSGSIVAAASKFTWLLIVPLLTIWLMMNWDAQRERFHSLLPGEHRDRLTHALLAVGRVLNSYVRGALVLALLYGAVTAFVLGVFFHMPYSLVLGLVAGLMSPIPYIGSIVILIATGSVAYATNPSLAYVLGVIVAMVVQNNLVFDNIIAPRVLGGSVGLSLPLSIFALMLGGSMFGIAGMILAVPVGATIKVLLMEFFPRLRGLATDEEQAAMEAEDAEEAENSA